MKNILWCILTTIGLAFFAYIGMASDFGFFGPCPCPPHFYSIIFPLLFGIKFWRIGRKNKNKGIYFGIGLGFVIILLVMFNVDLCLCVPDKF